MPPNVDSLHLGIVTNERDAVRTPRGDVDVAIRRDNDRIWIVIRLDARDDVEGRGVDHRDIVRDILGDIDESFVVRCGDAGWIAGAFLVADAQIQISHEGRALVAPRVNMYDVVESA